MKILIIGFTKIKYMPYMNFYLDNIDCKKNEVHIAYWNRDLQEEPLDKFQNTYLHEFKYYQEDEVGKLSKVKSFLKYRKFIAKLLEREKFDFLFVLHSLPGVLIADKLKKYNSRFILDYRDSTYEGFSPFKKVLGKIVTYSRMTFVSSDAFRKFLPQSQQGKIYTSHNLLWDSLNHRDEKAKQGVPSEKIRISFWGFIRNEDVNLEIIDKISKDDRFELHYYGREQQTALNLKEYVAKNEIKNVFFHGEYRPEDRYAFVRNTDIIHNIYSKNDANTMLAMGNKYYDGIIFRLPQVCMVGSFMGESAEKSGVGFSLDPQENNFTDRLYEYVQSLNQETFVKNCDEECQRVLNEYTEGIKKIQQI